jgi:hypothetical protein
LNDEQPHAGFLAQGLDDDLRGVGGSHGEIGSLTWRVLFPVRQHLLQQLLQLPAPHRIELARLAKKQAADVGKKAFDQPMPRRQASASTLRRSSSLRRGQSALLAELRWSGG